MLRPSPSAIQFLESLGEEDFNRLTFSDSLVTISTYLGTKIGNFKVAVSQSTYDGIDCLSVSAESHGNVDNIPCGMTIHAFVSKNKLETLSQVQNEYVLLEGCSQVKETTIKKLHEGYSIDQLVTQGQEVKENFHRMVDLKDMYGFISEGSSLLLQRLLTVKGLPEDFELLSLDLNNRICLSRYKYLRTKSETICGVPMELTGIERTILLDNHKTMVWHSYYMRTGFLSSRVRVGASVEMRLTSLTFEDGTDDTKCNGRIETKTKGGNKNGKIKLTQSSLAYLREHPEIGTLARDFVDFLLLYKPQDVTSFASKYFSLNSSSNLLDNGLKPLQILDCLPPDALTAVD